jgi:tetratricopeptide (TPR) repeat protein
MLLLAACDSVQQGGPGSTPTSAESYLNQGETQSAAGDCNGATDSFSRAINLKSEYWQAWRGRAHCYLILGRYSDAVDDYTQAIKLSSDPYSYEGRGDAYMLQGQYDLAISDYDQAITLKPDYAAAYQVRGFGYMLTGNLQRAIDDCGKALEIDPKRAEAYLSCAETYLTKGDYEAAVQHFDKAINLDSRLDEAYSFRGLAYAKMGMFDRAPLMTFPRPSRLIATRVRTTLRGDRSTRCKEKRTRR